MALRLLARTSAVAACLFLSGTESAECADTRMDVNSTADVQGLADALDCTGGGKFDVTWYGSVGISQAFEVAGGISLTVTGSVSSSLALDGDEGRASIVGDEMTSETGMFSVSSGSTLILNNLVIQGAPSERFAGGPGAVEAQGSQDAHTTVNVIDCLFTGNSGTNAGGISAANFSVVNIYGATNFTSNTGIWSGALSAEDDSQINLYGASTFRENTGTYGGAIGVIGANSTMYAEGDNSFVNNSATNTFGGGGAVYVFLGDVTFVGETTFTNNTSTRNGGAIYADEGNVTMEDVVFAGNSAVENGGAIYALFSNLSIAGNTMFTNNVALRSGGGVYSSEGGTVDISGSAYFVGNSASFDGGAMSIYRPVGLDVRGAAFELNEAASGGAVSLVAITPSTSVEVLASLFFRECTFEANRATDGGALYLFNNARWVNIDYSVFSENIAEASGGAIYHTGILSPLDTRFVANMAGVQGMAISSLGGVYSSDESFFAWNARYCPLGQYGYDEDLEVEDGRSTCRRADAVCTRCYDDCDEAYDALLFLSNTTAPAEDCKDLPTGTIARSAGTTLATLELAKGYYRTSNESHDVLECYQETACIGGLDANNYCAAGYEGPYCAVCSKDYAPGDTYSCHKCSGTSSRSAVGLALATLVVFLVVVAATVSNLVAVVKTDDSADEEQEGTRGSCKQRSSFCHQHLVKMFPLTSVKIVVVVWQIVTQFSAISGAVYPDGYQTFVSKLSPINLDIGFLLSSSCVANTNFYDRLLLTTMVPFVVLTVLVGTYAIGKNRNKRSDLAIRTVQQKHLSAALFVLFFVYASVSYTVFQTFVCDPLDDGVDYLRADYSLSCLSSQHARYEAYASVMVIVYPIGIPALFTWWLSRNRQDLSKPGREAVARLQPFSGLWAAYRPSRFYYEVVECGRRITLTGISVFVLPGSVAQLGVGLSVAVAFTFISESMKPFNKGVDMGLYRWGNGVVLASICVALLRTSDVSGDSTPTQSAFAAVLIAANVFMIIGVLIQSALLCRRVAREQTIHGGG